MTVPYTYLVEWTDLGKKYYGVRYAEGCGPSDLFVSYFTSSKVVADYIVRYGMPDLIQVRKVFTCKLKAQDWESRFLKRIDAANDDNFLNRSNGGSWGVLRSVSGENNPMFGRSGELNPFFGKTHTKEAKLKLSRNASKRLGNLNGMFGKPGPNLGKTFSDDTRDKMSKSQQNASKYRIPISWPHCGAVGKSPSIYRWHFDNCKSNILISEF